MAKVERCFWNKFYFAAWNIGFAFGAARLVKGCEYFDEIELWDVEKVEMAACVVDVWGIVL